MTLPVGLADRLRAAELDPSWVEDLVRATLEEDLAGGVDVTSVATIPEAQHGVADVRSRVHGVVAGLVVAEVVLDVVGTSADRTRSTRAAATPEPRSDAPSSAAASRVEVTRLVEDSAIVAPGDVVLTATGPVRDLLLAERTLLNFMCHLSGVATLTRRWVDATRCSGAAIRDSRKTLPLMRALQKYAVRCGGGLNHRMSLSDAALVKDNHVAAAGGVVAAFSAVRERFPDLPIEVEVDDVEAAVAAVDAGADLVLLDNFPIDELRRAVEKVGGRARLEASGGLTLARAREVAATGVDYLAVGALTHSAASLDLGLDLREVSA
jgi:nicotinate-nucleotide pyrophosphorylase (carboxylating)